ncbi:MAG: tRNA pseudouridine(38-40) synthase TruA [Gammaproteobacteria bacterium]
MRIALGIEYDGTRFSGWQTQSHARAIQPAVEHALTKVADSPVKVVCAGRTDAGVHACCQVVHFDTLAVRTMRAWTLGANAHLPGDVSVRWAQPIADHFNARFSAIARAYRYVITNRPTRAALWAHKVTWECRPLDVAHMDEAARVLLGEHDFTSFRAAGCQARHPVRTLRAISVIRDGELVVIDVEANAFLHHMVRNIAGTLLEIGRGERPVAWMSHLLAARDRTRGGMTAPPGGLYFMGVRYPEEFGLPGVEWAPPPGV